MGFDFHIKTKSDLKRAIRKYGFVPLFSNAIPGFSVEEHVAASARFSGEEGVWEWKGPVIKETLRLGCCGVLHTGEAVWRRVLRCRLSKNAAGVISTDIEASEVAFPGLRGRSDTEAFEIPQ